MIKTIKYEFTLDESDLIIEEEEEVELDFIEPLEPYQMLLSEAAPSGDHYELTLPAIVNKDILKRVQLQNLSCDKLNFYLSLSQDSIVFQEPVDKSESFDCEIEV